MTTAQVAFEILIATCSVSKGRASFNREIQLPVLAFKTAVHGPAPGFIQGHKFGRAFGVAHVPEVGVPAFEFRVGPRELYSVNRRPSF